MELNQLKVVIEQTFDQCHSLMAVLEKFVRRLKDCLRFFPELKSRSHLTE